MANASSRFFICCALWYCPQDQLARRVLASAWLVMALLVTALLTVPVLAALLVAAYLGSVGCSWVQSGVQ